MNIKTQIKKQLNDLLAGRVRHPRFTKQEIEASNGKQHENLWRFIFALEPARVYSGGRKYSQRRSQGIDSQGGDGLGCLWRLATRYECRAVDVIGRTHKYLDRGMESVVFLDGDGHVIKVRQLRTYTLECVVDQLANVVYHNYLFPNESYTLIDIAVYDVNGREEYSLILEQPLVVPLLDEKGYIKKPDSEEIIIGLKNTHEQFSFYDSSMVGEAYPYDDEEVEAGKRVAYNNNFYICDFQPGRNTFIDSETHKLRFIDPRIGLNNPNAGFGFSKYGQRTNNGFINKALTDDDYEALYERYAEDAEMDEFVF